MSNDHKPDLDEEKARILSNNGRIVKKDNCPSRVYIMDEDVPGLAVSRAFGDWVASSIGVTCIPEITKHTVNASDRVLILGSDGVWEFMTNQEVLNIYSLCKDPKIACDRIVEEASKRWSQNRDMIDDITCIVAELNTGEVIKFSQSEIEASPIGLCDENLVLNDFEPMGLATEPIIP